MSQARIDDNQMIAASETAKRNPMRPPDTLPRDAGTALRVFVSHASPQLILLFIVNLVLIWIATFNASEGVAYRYPMSLRLVTK